MKKLIIFSAIIATFFFGCKSQQKATGYTYDDVYSTRSDHSKITEKPKIQNEDLTGSHPVASPDSSSTLTSKSATANQDYSNNSYAARIKRFNGSKSGLDYNSEYYTGSNDSTSSGGSSPDVNVYFGNSWGSSFWGPSLSFGLGYGWGDCGFCYPYSWYSPYSWGYPYYSYYPYYYWDYPYWGGYGYGHHHGGWDWNNGFSRDYYYGQRRTLSAPDGGRNSRTNTNGTIPDQRQVKNTRTTDPVAVTRSADQTRSDRSGITRVPPDKQRYIYNRSRTLESTRNVSNNQNTKTRTERTDVQRQGPAPRYVRPGTQQQASRSETQTYSSPTYRQPKSSQEYINPRTQQGRPAVANGNYNRPAPSGRRYSPPSGNGGNARIYSNPSGGNRNYGTPSRSYSSPGNSGQSRSSGSGYSSPSRSGSSPSNSGGNSGSSGGGGRRR